MSNDTIPAEAIEAAMREILREQQSACFHRRAAKSLGEEPDEHHYGGCEIAYRHSLQIIRRHCRHFLEVGDE